MPATGAARGGALDSGWAAAGAAVATIVAKFAAVEDAFDDPLEPATTAAIQVRAILATIGTTDVVAIAVARISARWMALPIALVAFAAATVLKGFAAELRRVPATVTATAFATRVAIVATAADQTIDNTMLVMPAMRTAVGDHEDTNDDSKPSNSRYEHRELPPGRNLERCERWARLVPRGRSTTLIANRSKTTAGSRTLMFSGPLE